MPAQAVLINADDLGLWPSVDAGIFAARAAGAIGDSSVFATCPYLPAVLAQARAAALPVGVHLNLTFGRPLTTPEAIPALIDPYGSFQKRQAWTRPLPRAQVEQELRAQVSRLLALGVLPTHLDAHHHIHQYPEVFEVVVALALELKLPVRALDAEMRDRLSALGICAPDCFSMAFYGEHATVETLIRLVEECPTGVLEIMTHPGHDAPDLPSSYRAHREQELHALTAPAWLNHLHQRNIRIVGFRDCG